MKKNSKQRFSYDLAKGIWLDDGVPVERNGEHLNKKKRTTPTMKPA